MDKNSNIKHLVGPFSGFNPEITGRCKMCNDKLQSVDRNGVCFSCDMFEGSLVNDYANWGDFHEPKDKKTL